MPSKHTHIFYPLSLPFTCTVPREAHGLRLDTALGLFFPHLGLRARRRLWEWCRITINGRTSRPGLHLCKGEILHMENARKTESGYAEPHAVSVDLADNPAGQGSLFFAQAQANTPRATIRIEKAEKNLVALYKPPELHSVALAGSADPSLESLLPALWAKLWVEWMGKEKKHPGNVSTPPPMPLLLTRLDKKTSGLVMGALTFETAQRFRQQENQGLARKEYFALVRGTLGAPLTLSWRLDTKHRRQSKVLTTPDPDPARHSYVTPLQRLPKKNATLVLVVIGRGARHQIRAHLARSGHPLAGDTLYGGAKEALHESSKWYLHHARITLPGFQAISLPGWGWGEYLPDELTATAF